MAADKKPPVALLISLLIALLMLQACWLDDDLDLAPKAPSGQAGYLEAYEGDFGFLSQSTYRNGSYLRIQDTVKHVGYVEAVTAEDSSIMLRYRRGINGYCGETSVGFGAYVKPKLNPDGTMAYSLACWKPTLFWGRFHGKDTIDMAVGIGDSLQYTLHRIHGIRLH